MMRFKPQTTDYRIGPYAVMFISLGLLVFSLAVSGFFTKVEFILHDYRLRFTPRPDPSESIILVDIDDSSCERGGKWPWPREMEARMLDVLARAGAGEAVYDIVHHAPGSGDAVLAESMRSFGRVALPAGFGLVESDKRILLFKSQEDLEIVSPWLFKTPPETVKRLHQARGTFLPRQELAAASSGLGHVASTPDSDGVFRRVPLIIGAGGGAVPSLSLRAVMLRLGADRIELGTDNLLLSRGDEPVLKIPVDERGMMTINYSGRWGKTFTHIPAGYVCEAAENPRVMEEVKKLIKGKMVLISLAVSGHTDFGPTPLARSEPLVVIHANAINTMLKKRFIRVAPWWINLAAALVLIHILFVVWRRSTAQCFVVRGMLLTPFYIALNLGLFTLFGLSLNLSGVALATAGLYLFLLAMNYVRTSAENEKRLRFQEKLGVELEAASRIQASFQPDIPEIGHGAKVWAICEPAGFVGGDAYDFIPLADGSWIMYVADVCGKGLPASLVAASLWARFRSQAPFSKSASDLMREVHESLFDFLVRHTNIITVFACRFQPETGRLEFANAGHPPPVWAGPQGIKTVPEARDLPLGVIPDVDYQKGEIILEPGDHLLVMSDGVTEAENENKRLFGAEGVLAYVQEKKTGPFGPGLFKEVKKWRGRAERNDDLTLLEIWRPL